ncbi:Metal ABC transporter substrate-binding lipoprotein precursor [Corynebacterium faecale]|uniref:metal ABC transporter solute-binding protein, Zn/Mn family n=1 Tax=Corynebacterium faecale TaxID=1758466 RepID=UPI0025B3E40D|nr:zinc ABC transporter substrate-binding protein [Corynebacterium faecale]WJY93102.1 Metal ABC transporter substrate-binding lipoprotein precursor [Corynebacterium faecale]
MKKFLPLLLLLPLSACASPSEGDDSISIVASTQVWADVAEEMLPGTDVHAIVSGDTDPHSFEPSASDMARVENADIILVGGGGYDAWLYEPLGEDDRIISAMDLEPHDHSDHSDHSDNEHIWYSPEAVSNFAGDLTTKVREVAPDTQIAQDAVANHMAALAARIAELPEARVAQTEPIADHMLAHSRMIESTPAGYRATTLSEGEPTASDVAAFHEAIRNGDIDILIHNPQSAASVSSGIRDLAEENDIPVVDITETPEEGQNFINTFETAVSDLEQASR